MHHKFRWIAFALPLAVALIGAATTVQAFTDSNAELKEAAVERRAREVVTGQGAPATRTVWVPTSPKKLDGFAPVLPAKARAPQAVLAQAEARATRR